MSATLVANIVLAVPTTVAASAAVWTAISAQRQAAAAARPMLAEQPLVVGIEENLPIQWPDGRDSPKQTLGAVAAGAADDPDGARVSFAIRNIGAGPAILREVRVYFGDVRAAGVRSTVTTNLVPPNEFTRLAFVFQADNPDEDRFAGVAAGMDALRVVIAHQDGLGRTQPEATFSVSPRMPGPWAIRRIS